MTDAVGQETGRKRPPHNSSISLARCCRLSDELLKCTCHY